MPTGPRIRKLAVNPHFWGILFMFAVCIILHYPQQILDTSSPTLFSFMGLTRHAIERILLLVPVCYAGLIFGLEWGLVSLTAAAIIMIPRVYLVSEYFADAFLETFLVIVVGFLINLWIHNTKKEREIQHNMRSELDTTHRQLKKHTAILEVSERKYQELFENARDAIWEQDLDGNITNVNHAFETLSGSSRQELLGTSVKSYMDDESLNLAVKIRRSLYSGEPIEQPYEQRLTRKDGSVAVLQMATSLIRENGKPTGYLHIARDVTRREQLMAVLNFMEEGMAVIGHDRRIQFMNSSLVREFGDKKWEYCYQVFHDRDQPCDNCRFNSAIHGETEKREWGTPDGNVFEIVYTPFTNVDQTPGILATFINVTRRKKIERELVRLNDLKSELLDQKTAQLKEISQEVAKLEEEKKQFVRFLGIVAHDLKSPLSVSQSIISGITGGYYGPVVDEQKDMLERVIKRIDSLNALINDLIDIPLIESGQLAGEMSKISLAEIVQTTVNEFSLAARDKGLQIALYLPPDLPPVYGSSRRLHQVMTNLVSNAVKYAENGFIIIRGSENSPHIKIEVADNGIGIPFEDLPRLFTDFFRSKNSGGVKGTGLGLSICRRIIEAHGGKIWVESPNPETNTGSRFTFILPVYREEKSEELNQIK